MSELFKTAINLPVIEAAPEPIAGLVRIYGRGVEAYALFPDGTEKLLTGAGDVIVVDSGEVLENRLTYDQRENSKASVTKDTTAIVVAEKQKRALESVTSALAARALEIGQKATETNAFVVALKTDVAKKATDDTAVVGFSREQGRRADDTVQAVIFPTAELAKKAVEDVSNTVFGMANEVGAKALDSHSIIPFVLEVGQAATDTHNFELSFKDSAKRAVEDISNSVIARAQDSARRAVESIEAAIVARTETARKATDTEFVQITLNAYANQNVQTTTWTNPANAQGNTTGTSASLTATSSGLAGTTNNTATGILALGFRDVNLGDLTINSVILSVENSGAGAGVAIAQPTANIQYQYSLNNGGSWTTFYTHNTATLAKGIRTVNITSIVGQDQSLLSALQIRATGSVTSGTGLGAAYTASFFRAWMTVQAQRNYS